MTKHALKRFIIIKYLSIYSTVNGALVFENLRPLTVQQRSTCLQLEQRRWEPSKEQAYLRSMFMSDNYTNPNTNPRTLTTLTLTEQTITHDVYKEICV